jgi:hypothetical protein
MGVQSIVTPVLYGQIPVKVFHLSSLADGDTLVLDNSTNSDAPPPCSWWITNTSDATKITVSYSSGSFTFALDAVTSPSADLFIVSKATIQR